MAALLLAGGSAGNFACADMTAAQTAIEAHDYATAANALRPLAEAGDAEAQYQWAALALDGHDVGLKPDQAMSLMVQSAAQGNGHAEARLGLAYAKGDQVTQNDLAAFQWLSRASASPDLSETERTVVTTNRQIILGRLSPAAAAGTDNQSTTTSTTTTPQFLGAMGQSSAEVKTAAQPFIAQPSSAAPIPADSISAVPYFSSKPLDPASGTTVDPAPAASRPPAAAPIPSNSISTVPYFSSRPLDQVTTASGNNGSGDNQAGKIKPEKTASAAPVQPASSQPVAPQPVATPSTAAPSTAQAAAIQPMTTKPSSGFAIQLASLPNETAAQAEEDRLRQQFGTVLTGLTLSRQSVDLGGKGIHHRILAGPFDNWSDAKSRCAQLRAAKQDCIVVPTRG